MKIRTPVQLFGAITGVGLVPAIAIGSVIGVSNKDYHPIPRPSASASFEGFDNLGTRPEPVVVPTKTKSTGTQRRVEFVEPTRRVVKQRKATPSKTPHASTSPTPKPRPSPSKTVPTFEATPTPPPIDPGIPEPTPAQKISEGAS